MKGPREYKRLIAKRRQWVARRGVKNGSVGWMDDPGMERLLYNSKRLLRRAGAVAAAVTLAACSTPSDPKVRVVEVKLAVPTSCIPKDKDPGEPKPYADAVLPTGAEAVAERFRFIAAANEQRKARLAILEALLPPCR